MVKKGNNIHVVSNLVAIDPGSSKSAIVVGYPGFGKFSVVDKLLIDNCKMYGFINSLSSYHTVIIEEIKSYGMPVGQSTIDTCYVIGRLQQLCSDKGFRCELVPRKTVVATLCGRPTANDSNIRQVIRDRYSKEELKGIKYDLWSAMAIGTTYIDLNFRTPPSPRTATIGEGVEYKQAPAKKEADDFLEN